MGKDSKHQRTKGGVQPSNSGRTAELLAKKASGATSGGALSFLSAAAEAHLEFGVKPPPISSPLTHLLTEDDLPPQVRLVFRKLQKKDAVTKIKALSELSQILGGPPPPLRESSPSPSSSRETSRERAILNPSEIDDLSKLLLPHWIQAYQKLVLDDSRKVRETAQLPLGLLCARVGRNLAPYLKQLMPSWYLAQNDLYSPVASAAARAFRSLFPEDTKRSEVLKYCRDEVIKVILENLGSVFVAGGGKLAAGGKDKKQKGKNKGQKQGQGQNEAEEEGEGSAAPAIPGDFENPSSNRGGDGETYALRTTCASLQSLKTLIEAGLVDEETLEVVFGARGLFWGGNELSKELLVRRIMYDTLSSLTTHLSKTPPPETPSDPPSFTLPASIVTKFIQNALNTSTHQKETLPNLWQAFLLLTLNGVLSDASLARKQLLTSCKNGFYGNASQLGSSVYPLLHRIWEGFGSGDEKQEFSHDILTSTISGYSVERSLFERAAIARVLGDVVGFLARKGDPKPEMGPVYGFIYSHLGTGGDLGDFARLFGTLVVEPEYYDGFLEYGFDKTASLERVLDSKDFGRLLVNLCTPCDPSAALGPSQNQGHCKPGTFIKRRVQFREEEDQDEHLSSSTCSSTFSSLSSQKQDFLSSVVSRLVSSTFLQPLPILARSFPDPQLWSAVNISDLLQSPSSPGDNQTRLQLYLELLRVFPEIPSLLGKFSEEFEAFSSSPSTFKTFLKEIDPYLNLTPVKRWVRMTHFTTVLETFLLSSTQELEEAELLTILKFIFHRKTALFSPEFTSGIISKIVERVGTDAIFSENLAHILTSGSGSFGGGDLTPIYKYYWETYFLESVLFIPKEIVPSSTGVGPETEESSASSSSLELIESVCFSNLSKLDSLEVVGILEKYLESCDTVRQIDTLLAINKKLGFPGEILQPLPQAQIRVKPDFVAFLGLSYAEPLSESGIDPVPKFSKIHRSAISKAIFKGKLTLAGTEDANSSSDCIVPLLNVIYAQSLSRIWEEVEKSDYFEKSNRELASELDVISFRLTEKVYEELGAWRNLWEILEQNCSSPDPLWNSRLPLRILSEYCVKAELVTGQKTASLPNEPFSTQVTQVLEDFSRNSYKVQDVISWLSEKRVKEGDSFEFDVVFRHAKNPGLLTKLLSITTQLLARLDGGDELSQEFLSLGTCWISAWLKMSRNLVLGSKSGLQWVAGLARAVTVIATRARDPVLGAATPKFVQEYAEFHASQLYPVIYSIYVQLNEEIDAGGANNNFWTLQTLFYVSQALVGTPSNTLAYIEPDGVKLCEIFGKILGSAVSLPSRIAAYRVLKKVRYDRTGEGDLPIVPPVIGAVIRSLVEKVYSWKEGEDKSDEESDTPLISYLLIWDALLKIQQGSNEFATYVRDQDHLLTPFLNTLFLSERIPLEDAAAKHFDKDLHLLPGSPVPLLQLSCSVVLRTLRNLPYTVRWWWNNQVSRQRDRVFVEKFIVKHLSSKLAKEELGSVQLRQGVDDNVTVHCHSGCNQLVAHYRIEETNVTLTVSLPLNHPLGPVTVKISDKKLHGKINQLLNTRSHSLSAGLKLWKENLDGLYKDVDECAICFFILHNVTKQIPKLGCKTCKKKFHAACLYKWFSTSNKSECPLCRNLF